MEKEEAIGVFFEFLKLQIVILLADLEHLEHRELLDCVDALADVLVDDGVLVLGLVDSLDAEAKSIACVIKGGDQLRLEVGP